MEAGNLDDIISRMTPNSKLEEAAHIRIKLASWGVPVGELAVMTLKELLELEKSGKYLDRFAQQALAQIKKKPNR